jgi:actin-related protein
MAISKEVFVLDNGAYTAKVGISNSEHPRYVILKASLTLREIWYSCTACK